MILNTGQRTDIPAFYSEWFMNRIKEGYVYVRNPFYPTLVTKFILDSDVVDVLCFCSKNPKPMLKYIDQLKAYHQLWYVTITPYGRDIERNVPSFKEVIETFKELSTHLNSKCVIWRYDPIFIDEKYSVEYHVRAFNHMAKRLMGYTDKEVISFIDLFDKVKRNFPEVTEPTHDEQERIIKAFVSICKKYNMQLYTCCENKEFAKYGVIVSGCMSQEVIEDALDLRLNIEMNKARKECQCLLGNDIGSYNSCLHGCKYCYANNEMNKVKENFSKHDPASPLLIGHIHKEDQIVESRHNKSNIDSQIFFDF